MTPNNPSKPLLTIKEAKTRELVPCFEGVPLHSLHNPRREAEVFASNHLAHVSRTPNLLVLGLGFGYHLEELSKIVQLKHKSCRIVVIEAYPELIRLQASYQKPLQSVEVVTAATSAELWDNKILAEFLLEKPAVIIHSASFAVAKDFYSAFLKRKAPLQLNEWNMPRSEWHAAAPVSPLAESLPTANGELGNWLRAYWECKHAP